MSQYVWLEFISRGKFLLIHFYFCHVGNQPQALMHASQGLMLAALPPEALTHSRELFHRQA